LGLFDPIINRIKSKSEKKKDLAERIKNEEVQLISFEKDYIGKYIYRYSYKSHEDICRALQLEALKLHVSIKSFQKTYSEFVSKVEIHNREYLAGKVDEGYNLIGNVEGQQLDKQQMSCIVKDAENHLVVAGAGTGKTTTILGKVKYLLKTTDIKPEEFLIVSFTNAAAAEMKNRLQKETKENLYEDKANLLIKLEKYEDAAEVAIKIKDQDKCDEIFNILAKKLSNDKARRDSLQEIYNKRK
jgi:DNA helicase-4